MSMAGSPKVIARKGHAKAVAQARARFNDAIKPAQRAYVEMIRPAQEQLQKDIADADAAFFKKVAA